MTIIFSKVSVQRLLSLSWVQRCACLQILMGSKASLSVIAIASKAASCDTRVSLQAILVSLSPQYQRVPVLLLACRGVTLPVDRALRPASPSMTNLTFPLPAVHRFSSGLHRLYIGSIMPLLMACLQHGYKRAGIPNDRLGKKASQYCVCTCSSHAYPHVHAHVSPLMGNSSSALPARRFYYTPGVPVPTAVVAP